jgi:hypothetical protein
LIDVGRRPPGAQTATGRLPLGTPAQFLAVSDPHSHIRIVPRAASETTDNANFEEDNLPIFRSPSLQFPPPIGHDSRRGSAQSDVSATGTTFADMARRFHQTDYEGTERPTSGPVPLAGFIQLKTARSRQGNKTWRTPDPSAFAMSDSLGSALDADASSSTAEVPSSPPEQHTKRRATPFDLPTIQTTLQSSEPSPNTDIAAKSYDALPVLPAEGSVDVSPTDTRFNVGVMQSYSRVFGRLPDLIHLHEQTGGFDGQIIFIGHPNRDISAHQWSSASFQWDTIGNWSHTRAKIEGSLACDRLPDTGLDANSIDYFKHVAQNREKMIKEFGRPKQEAESEVHTDLTSAENTASQSAISGTPSRTLPREETSSTIPSTYRNITREHLEDPFVTPVKPSQTPQPAIPMSLNLRGAGAAAIGAMNFNYEFPSRPTHATGAFVNHQVYMQRERERLDLMRDEELPQERDTPTHLREIRFGEEASSAFSTPVARVARTNTNRLQGPLSPEDVHNRQQLKNKLSELGAQPRRPSLPTEQRIAVPDVPMLNHNIKALFPPGPTVANPTRGMSTLNANAPAYRMPFPVHTSDDSESEPPANTVPRGPTLHFSDPDGVRHNHVPEIANGLKQQAPTQQNFKGPFFADSMPTSYNLTASLAVSVSHEEKLANWFRDGQRPARLQDRAKSLMATAWANNKARSLGAIGGMSSDAHDGTKYENTPSLMFVYENLFEYAEDSRAGVSSSYFTRSWKPAPLHLRDITPDGNNSFFSRDTTILRQGGPVPSYSMGPSPAGNWGSVAQKKNIAGPGVNTGIPSKVIWDHPAVRRW